MGWAGHVARMAVVRAVYRILLGKPERRRPPLRPRRRWVDNIRMYIQKVGCGNMECIGLAQEWDSCRTIASALMNIGFREMRGISLLGANQLASHE